jgi:hypothetical protein
MLGWQGGLLDNVVVSVELVTWCCLSSVGTVVWHRRLSVGVVRWLAVCHSRVRWAGVALSHLSSLFVHQAGGVVCRCCLGVQWFGSGS